MYSHPLFTLRHIDQPFELNLYFFQYTSLIFYHDDEQKQTAEKSFKEQEKQLGQSLVTEILPASTFYDAEEYVCL